MANKLIIDIDGNTKGLESKLSGLGATAKKAFSGVESVGTKALSGITAGVGAASAAVAGLATAAIKSFADYEQLTGGIETLFKTSYGTVMQYAENAYKTAGMSANQYMENMMNFSASLIQGLGGNTAEAARIGNIAIMDMADNVNKMGSSMEMVEDAYRGFAKGNFTMLDNLKLGYGGTREEMLRLVNDSGVLEHKVYDLSQVSFDQMIMAIHKVQENLGVTGTTAMEAEKTISGSANSAKAAWKNLVTGIADDNQDFGKLVKRFVDSTATLMGNLLPRVKMALEGVNSLVTAMFPLIIDQIPYLINDLLPQIAQSGMNIIHALLSGISQNLSLIKTSASSIMQMLYDGLLDLAGNLMPIAKELIGTVAQGFLMYKSLIWTIGIELIDSLLQGIQSALPSLVPMAQNIITNIVSMLTSRAPEMLGAAIQILLALANGLTTLLPSILPQITGMVSTLVGMIIANAPMMLNAALNLLLALATGLSTLLPTIVPQIVQLVTGIVTFIAEHANELLSAATSIITALANGLIAAIPVITAALPQVITGIVTALTNGENIAQILAAGLALLSAITQAIPDVLLAITAALPQLVTGIVTFFTTGDQIGKVAQSFVTLLTSIGTVIPQIIATLAISLAQIVSSIAKYFVDHKLEIVQSFSDIGKGISTAVSLWWIGIKSKIEELCRNVVNAFKNLWLDLVGHSIVWDIINDVVSAFSGWWDLLKGAIETVVNNIKSKFGEAKDAVVGFFKNIFGMGEDTETVAIDAEANIPDLSMAQINPLEPVPQPVIDSYTALSLSLQAVNAEIAKLNAVFGGVAAMEEGSSTGGESATGGTSSLLVSMTAVATYIEEEFTTVLNDFVTFLLVTFVPAVEKARDLLYIPGGGGNTLYNSLGEIQGVTEDIREAFNKLIIVWRVDFVAAVDRVKQKSGELLGVLHQIEEAGWAIAAAFTAALLAIQAVVEAQNGVRIPNSSPWNNPNTKNPEMAAAWGGWTSVHGLTLVGERGPELIGTSRMMNVWRHDEVLKQLERARWDVRSMNVRSPVIMDARSEDRSITNNNSTNLTFGNVYGEDYLSGMIDAAIERYTRKAVFLGKA